MTNDLHTLLNSIERLSDEVCRIIDLGPVAKRLNAESLGDAVPAHSGGLRPEPKVSALRAPAAIARRELMGPPSSHSNASAGSKRRKSAKNKPGPLEAICETCGRPFKVRPAPANPWPNCLAPDCASYDPARDLDDPARWNRWQEQSR